MSRSRILALLSGSLLVSMLPFAHAATNEPVGGKTGQAEPAKAPVAVMGLPASKELKLTAVTTPDLIIPLTIENQTTGDLKGVELHSTELRTPAGDVAAPEADPKGPFDIGAGASQSVKLKVQLLSAGTYTATVTVAQAPPPQRRGARPTAPKTLLRFSLEIARTAAAPPIAIADIAALGQESSPFRTKLSVPLSVTIYTTGGEVSVSRPFLDDVTRKPKVDSTSGSLASNVTLDLQKVRDPITVKPGQPTLLPAGIGGITSPGRYDGTIRFAPGGFQPVSKAFIIYVRDPWWVALVFIAVGAGCSLLVLGYSRTLRPRLLAQERVTTLLLMLRAESARATGDPDAEALVGLVRQNIKTRWDDAQAQRRAITTELDVLGLIVPALGSWIPLHKQVREVRPIEVRAELMPTLDDAGAAFGNPNPDATKVQTAIGELTALPQKIRAKIGEKLKKQVADLTASLAQYPHPSMAEIVASVQEAAVQLTHDRVEEAIKLVESARLRYANLLADELIKRVAAPAAPAGMEQDKWDALKLATTKAATVVAATQDPDDATTRLIVAAVPYVIAVSDAIEKSATDSLNAQKRQPVLEATAAAKAAVAQNVADGLNKLDAAAKRYEQAIAGPGKTMGEVSPELASLARAAIGAAPGGPSFDGIGSFGSGPPASVLDQPGALAATTKKIERFDVFVSVVVAIAAGIAGVQFLWIDNPVWGDTANYLAAFSWGFAIDQFSHAGVAALRK